jgi:predicted GIY-YIG superfamily endonuclease
MVLTRVNTAKPKKKTHSKRKAYFVYIVRCRDGTFYTGIADDVKRRVGVHNGDGTAGAKYTRSRRPVVLVYSLRVKDRGTALRREYALKQLTRIEKLELINRTASRKRGAILK